MSDGKMMWDTVAVLGAVFVVGLGGIGTTSLLIAGCNRLRNRLRPDENDPVEAEGITLDTDWFDEIRSSWFEAPLSAVVPVEAPDEAEEILLREINLEITGQVDPRDIDGTDESFAADMLELWDPTRGTSRCHEDWCYTLDRNIQRAVPAWFAELLREVEAERATLTQWVDKIHDQTGELPNLATLETLGFYDVERDDHAFADGALELVGAR